MSKEIKTVWLVALTFALSAWSGQAFAGAGDAPLGAFPSVNQRPADREKSTLTNDDLSKLKADLNRTRDRVNPQAKAKAPPPKSKKP